MDRPNKPAELTGQVFGKLRVVRMSEQKGGKHGRLWECECMACGRRTTYSTSRLRHVPFNVFCACENRRRKGIHIKPGYDLCGRQKTNKETRRYNTWLGRDVKCPMCGKMFLVPGSEWGYEVNEKKLCSYKCMRLMEKKYPPKKPKMEEN